MGNNAFIHQYHWTIFQKWNEIISEDDTTEQPLVVQCIQHLVHLHTGVNAEINYMLYSHLNQIHKCTTNARTPPRLVPSSCSI